MENEDEENYEKVPEGQTLRGPDLLKTLPPHTKLFDNLSSTGSDLSEISGPFSDVVYNVETQSKRKTKDFFGKDLYTAFSFSPEFKTVMDEIKKEMIVENPDYLKTETMVTENFEEIKSGLLHLPPESDSEILKKYMFLQGPLIEPVVEEEEEEKIEDKKKDKEGKEKKKKITKIWERDDETFYDTMSGYWRMLSVFDEFRISPPWYDAYAEGQKHWLQTNPIPAEKFEESRKKCLNWLDKYFDK